MEKNSISNELNVQDYYNSYLNKSDRVYLKSFLDKFVLNLDIPICVLVVGSSVFPLNYWKHKKKVKRRNSLLNVSLKYNDIDLLILPESIISFNNLESKVVNSLENMNCDFKKQIGTKMGVSYLSVYKKRFNNNEMIKQDFLPFLNVDYGLNSICVYLKNKTNLDLILGRDDLLNKTASEKILLERELNNYFSILHHN